jgi:hypothetical protein
MMKTVAIIASVLLAGTMHGAVNVPLTIQEALFPGDQTGRTDTLPGGIARTNAPVCMGVPLADSAGITDLSKFQLAGAAAGQFRVLGFWPSGNVKWAEVCAIVPSMAAGSTATITLSNDGSGNFGGASLATDSGATITVATGAATFTLKKANHNGLDVVDVGSTHVVLTGTSSGFVLLGPNPTAAFPGNVTCSPDSAGTACTTIYSSANDSSSTCSIEKNGPVQAVVKCTFDHKDGNGNTYMHGTARYYFNKGKTSVRLVSALRNADYGASGTFASAYKGHHGYDFRLGANISGPATYNAACPSGTTGCPTGTVSGTINATDGLYLYQSQAHYLKTGNWCGAANCVPYTTDTGYRIVKTVSGTPSTVASDTTLFTAPGGLGWADVANSSGAGIEIGVPQIAGVEMKSLEFWNGGTDVRIGLLASENSQPYYEVWPQWNLNEAVINFHAGTPASLASDFLILQHPLAGRALYTYYNSTAVFPYTLLDPVAEDNWYKTAAASANPATIAQSDACCVKDLGWSGSGFNLSVYPWWAWGNGGADTEVEYRWSNLLTFITRGWAGRYQDAALFYRKQASQTFPMADGFNWRDQQPGELDSFGQPNAASTNSAKAGRNWHDQEHFHWYGIGDFYFMSGDETIRDSLLEGPKDYFVNSNTIQTRGNLWNSRANGSHLIGVARIYQFLKAIGDSSADVALANGVNAYTASMKSEMCLSGYPGGCATQNAGTSRTRGARWGLSGELSDTWCGVPHAWRMTATFQTNIAIQSILELRAAKGPGWSDYWDSLDLAYGISRWLLSEMFHDDGSGHWDTNGFYYYMALDGSNACNGPGETPDPYFVMGGQQPSEMAFLGAYLGDGKTDWANKFTINWQKLLKASGASTSEHTTYLPAHIISILSQANTPTLQDVAITSVVNTGNGAYTISWTVPTGTQSYRIKWATKRIVDWLNFNPLTNTFGIDPATATPWFAATNVPLPAPGPATTVQSVTINTGVPGLTVQNFSVKAYITGTAPPPPPGPATTLSIVSGNNQTGTVAQQLASPFTARVTNAAGSPVAGVAVTFAAALGGGSVNPAQVATDSQGMASSTLTLGPTAGANTVTAVSGTLSGSPATFTATATTAATPSSPLIAWRQSAVLGLPHPAQWQLIHYEPVGQTIIIYQSSNSSIYSNGIWNFKASNESISLLGTSGSTSEVCLADTDTWPGDRHPMGQMAIDTRRNVMWLAGGVCGGDTRTDTYQLRLNANPSNNTWRRLLPTTFPIDTRFNSMVYDPDDDILFTYGYDVGADTEDTFIYCPTDLNPAPGTLTPAQTSAGCISADNWNEVAVRILGGGKTATCAPSPYSCLPPDSRYPGLVYDTRRKKIVLVGGYPELTPVQTWMYDVPTRTWTQLLPQYSPPTPSEVLHRQAAVTYNASNGLIYFHDSTGPSDWTYNLQSNTWTSLGNLGGPMGAETIAYDPSVNALIAWSKNPVSGQPEIWIGQLTGAAPPAGPCDLNSDGVINVIDIQIVAAQSSGAVACGKGDLNRDGRCDNADLQIVVAAALAGVCRTGQ